MSKAIQGIAELGAVAAIVGGIALTGGAAAALVFATGSSWGATLLSGLAITGAANAAGAIADALTANRGMNITTRQAAGNRQIIYGQQRIGGCEVYNSTTGGKHDQDNNVIVLAGHTIDGITDMYLDGRRVNWASSSAGQVTCPGGYTFGGNAGGGKFYDSGGYSYNFDSLVFATAYFGAQTAAGGACGALQANDPRWATTANGTPYGGGCSWVYFKFEYDTVTFSAIPEVKFAVRGRNQIWDPRTNATGYTANWALCVADFLCDPEFGFGYTRSEINEVQLIVAANLCDELVPLANGGSEPRYTFNGHWDTTVSPGDALASMLSAAQGNVILSGGQWYIFPAAAVTPSFSFSETHLLEDIAWKPYKSVDGLINRVRGIYTAPNYPYAPTGNLYDRSGKDPDGYQQDNFNYAWQPTDYPEYAQDPLHGYATDLFLEQDLGRELVGHLNLPNTISVATAQRLAKIYLMRNRQQGTGTLTMHLSAFGMMPMDVFNFSYAPYGWVNKQLQVTSVTLVQEYKDGGPRAYVQVEVREFDPNVYAWQASEELSPLDNPNYALQHESAVAVPTSLTLTSGAGTNLVNGLTIVPRVEVQWTDPEDVLVTLIDVQWTQFNANAWHSIGTTPVGNGIAYIVGPAPEELINVRICSIRSSGATSAWLYDGDYPSNGFLVSTTTIDTITSINIAPGIPFNVTNDATIDTYNEDGVCVLRLYGPGGPGTNWTLYTGAGTYSNSSAFAYINFGETAYVGAVVGTFPASGNLDLGLGSILIESDFNNVIGDNKIYLGTVTAIASDGTGGTTGGGGQGGGPRNPGCTAEGTMLDTPNGPVSNILLKCQFDAKLPVFLSGASGPERIVWAQWEFVHHHQKLTVGAVEVECSNSHTVESDGVWKGCSLVPTGAKINTRSGPQIMKREDVFATIRVLHLKLAGPDHVYSYRDVLTHNAAKTA